MRIASYLAASSALVAAAAAAAPPIEIADGWSLTPSAQIRPRLLTDGGRDFVDGDTLERVYVTQRSRLGVALKGGERATIVVQIQDVRIWGEEANTLDFAAEGLDLHQAYANLNLGAGFALRLGRQEIVLDDSRLIGNVGWTQRARAFDAARLSWRRGGLTLDGFGAVIVEDDVDADGHIPDGRSGDVGLFGLHGAWALDGALTLAPAVYAVLDDATESARHTLGLYARGKAEPLSYEGQLWYQLGHLGPDDAEISALMAAARVTWATPLPGGLAVTLWGEYLSGDSTPTGAFDTLYATNHKFYGEMDRFINVPRDTALLGLIDIGGRLALAPLDTLTLSVDGHHFRTAEPDGQDQSTLGTEIDTSVRWVASDGISLRALHGIFLPDDAMGSVRGLADEPATEHLVFVTADITL